MSETEKETWCRERERERERVQGDADYDQMCDMHEEEKAQ
jgi:hypothetical protein